MTTYLPGVQLFVEDASGGLVPVTEIMLQGNGSVTPIDLSGNTITSYLSQAALLAATPLADEIGVVSQAATDGHRGKAYAWDLESGAWTILTAVSSVNGETGVVVIDADNVDETAARKWLTAQERNDIAANRIAVSVLQSTQTAQDAAIAAIQAINVTQGNDIDAIQLELSSLNGGSSTLGDRLTEAETDITALQNLTATQGANISLLTSQNATQDVQLADLFAGQTTQNTAITTLQTQDAIVLSRLDAVEAKNVAQDGVDAALAVRVTDAEGDIATLQGTTAGQAATLLTLDGRLDVAEADIVAIEGGLATINGTLSGLPTIYQVRSEKDQPGGYAGLRPDGTIDPLQLPASAQVIRDITPVATLAERDALAANDPRPEVNGPWGANQIGYSVFVTDTGAGDAGWFIWNGATFLDFTSSISILSTTDVPEGTRLYFTIERVATAPAVVTNTADIAALEVVQATHGGRLDAIETEQATQNVRLDTAEGTLATAVSDIAGNIAAITANDGDIAANTAAIAANTGAIAANDADIAALQTTQNAQDVAIALLPTSFNGRTGAVVPTAGDYDNSQITNVSLVPGATTALALNALQADIDAIDTTIGSIDDKVTNGGDAGTVTVGTNNASDLVLIQGGFERIRLTGVGTKFSGLTESVNATGLLAVNPSDGSLYVKPEHKTIYVSDSDLPIATWVNATTVSVGSGRAICKDSADLNSERLWRHPVGAAAITATLPAITPGVTAYLFLASNDAGDATAFISTANPPNNNPVGFNWVRLLTAFVVNGSAQLNPFVMDGERWVTGNFASETFIAEAAWASKVIPECPLGKVDIFAITSPGFPVVDGFYNIKLSTTNPTTAAISVPSGVTMIESAFDGSMSAFYQGERVDYRGATTNVAGVVVDRLLWHYKTGSAYLAVNIYPTVRLLKYRTVLK